MTSALADFYRGKRILLTGHTGFKGSWLGLWLTGMGAEVHGLALDPETEPNAHALLRVPYASDLRQDLRDADGVARAVAPIDPQLVFHLAAQPLVRRAYRDPLESFGTNVMGTANLLQALRNCPSLQAVLGVTSDKAYDNDAYDAPKDLVFAETDRLGGRDPYSASKGAQEIVIRSFAESYFAKSGVRVATARAGNVIGGGDWAEDRLMTDAMAALLADKPIPIRNPLMTRPWQHVLEPLAGYLLLLRALAEGRFTGEAMNFGPDESHSVQTVADRLCALWGGEASWAQIGDQGPKEAKTLALTSALAKASLGWKPRLDLDATLGLVAGWYKAWAKGADMGAFSAAQIEAYAARMDA